MVVSNVSLLAHIEHAGKLAPHYPLWACDVWGVVHDGRTPYKDAVAALIKYRGGGGRVLLLTNAPRPSGAVIKSLDYIGVPREAYDGVVTSGDVTRELLKTRGQTPVYHIGPFERDRALFDDLGLVLTGVDDAQSILCTGPFDDVTDTPDDYRELFAKLAARKLPMICANPDLVVDRGGIRIYCAGALAKAYEEAGGGVIYAGKPYGPVYDLALRKFSDLLGRPATPPDILAIGDGLNTDIRGGIGAGWDTLFIAGGIHAADVRREGGLEKLFRDFTRLPIGWQDALRW